MKIVKIVLAVLVLSLFGALLAPGVRAQDNKTIVTISEPVEVPGQVLPAGTYTFKVLDRFGYRSIVQIFNDDGTHLITTILAIDNYRLVPTGKTVLSFAERAGDNPEALKAWFYPGKRWGQQFVYPKERAIQLAAVTKEVIPAIPAETANLDDLKAAPIVAITPEQKEVPVAEVIQTVPETAPAAAPAAAPVLAAENVAPATLPATASELPLIALLAIASLGFAFVLKRIAG